MGQRTTWVLVAVVILSAIGVTLVVHHRAPLEPRMPEVIPGGTAPQMPSARATAASDGPADGQPPLDPATETREQRTVVCLDAHDPKTWDYYRCPGKFMAIPKDPLEHEGAVHVTPITP
jgi:hypothetical protein